MDKSCSLAFGRPAFLPTAVYQNIPLPDDDVLLRFPPRDGEENAQNVSRIGAQFFKRSVDLSKLTGLILDASPTGDSLLARRDIRSKLDHWYQGTVQVSTIRLIRVFRIIIP